MSRENVEIVRRIVSSWRSGDFTAGADNVDRHVILVVSEDFPEAGVFVGPAAIAEYLRRFLANWQRYSMEPERINVVGDTVVVGVRQHGSGRDGVTVEFRASCSSRFAGRQSCASTRSSMKPKP
jgi:ketosteroid isomerase-like protein